MRPIIFRGKRFAGAWVEGDLIRGVGRKKGKMYILPIVENFAYLDGCDPLDGYEVIPETVGQYTGVNDNDGIKIFEGDYCSILDVTTKPTPTIGVVEYTDQACFEVFDQKHLHGLFLHNPIDLSNYIQELRKFLPNTPRTINVIGNIHDNKNLING